MPHPFQTPPRLYTSIDARPDFQGNINDYLARNLRYPARAKKKGREGTATVRFIVGQDGCTSDAAVVRSTGVPSLDSEAVRLVRAMPPWKPGLHDNQPVKVYWTLPITFKLED